MIITTKVKVGASQDSVSYDKENKIYLVTTRALPVDGEANKRIILLLSKYLDIPKSQINLKSGSKSKIKRFEY